MCAFHASTDPTFTRNGPVRVFSYGSPYVGGLNFARAFRHQEMCGKLLHARVTLRPDMGRVCIFPMFAILLLRVSLTCCLLFADFHCCFFLQFPVYRRSFTVVTMFTRVCIVRSIGVVRVT